MLYCCQVEEKANLGITAVNLTKIRLNKKTAAEVARGKYSFIYVVSDNYRSFIAIVLTVGF